MPLELPSPPLASRFRLDRDAQGRPRLTWPYRITWTGCLAGCGVTAFFSFILFGLAWDFLTDADLRANFARNGIAGVLSSGGVLLRGLFALLALFVLVLFLRSFLPALLFGRRMRRGALVFGEDALWYQPNMARPKGRTKQDVLEPIPVVEGSTEPARSGQSPVREVRRARVRAVGVVRRRGATHLLLAAGTERLEIGPTLKGWELIWLAGVLRAWAGLDKSAPRFHVPPPPADSWIQRDSDEADRLYWLPPEEQLDAGRGRRTRRVLGWFLQWLVGELLGVGLLVLQFRSDLGALGCLVWLIDVALLWLLPPWTVGGLAIVTELVSLSRAPRPESMVLGPDQLRHDPGHYYCGPAVSTGRPREIERAEIARVRVEQLPGGRERLLLDFGNDPVPALVVRAGPRQNAQGLMPLLTVPGAGGPVEVGACLRPAERAWLAEVLRAWAGTRGP